MIPSRYHHMSEVRILIAACSTEAEKIIARQLTELQQSKLTSLTTFSTEIFYKQNDDIKSICTGMTDEICHFQCHFVILERRLFMDNHDNYQSLKKVSSIAHCILLFDDTKAELEEIHHAHYTTPESIVLSHLSLLSKTIESLVWKNRTDSLMIQERSLITKTASLLKLYEQVSPEDIDREIAEALEFLFPHHRSLKVSVLDPKRHSADISSAPRLRSAILIVDFRESRLPAIVKIARIERIQNEFANYERFIDNKLEGMRYARIEKHVLLWHIGAIAYSFIGDQYIEPFIDGLIDTEFQIDPKRKILSFTRFYRDNEAKDIKPVIRELFRGWRRHYNQRKPIDNSQLTIFEQYDDVWDTALDQRLRQFENRSKQLSFLGIDKPLPNPVTWLLDKLQHDHTPFVVYQAITHGDFHADNIFVDGGYCWFIDFERSGYGPLLQDFVEFEVDILTRLVDLNPQDSGDMEAAYELYVAVGQSRRFLDRIPLTTAIRSRPLLRKALDTINTIRDQANTFTNSIYYTTEEYLWGLLFNSLFRATYLFQNHIEVPQRELSLLLGAIICERLDKWKSNHWPPEDWPKVVWAETNIADYDDSVRRTLATEHTTTLPYNATQEMASTSTPDLPANTFFLSIGVGDIRKAPELNLPVTVEDALAIWETLIKPEYYNYQPEMGKILYNKTASKQQILYYLDWLANQSFRNPNSTVIIYFSGHGIMSPQGRFGLVPSDFDATEPLNTMISGEEFIGSLKKLEADRLLVFIDSCHAAGMVPSGALTPTLPSGYRVSPLPDDIIKQIPKRVGKAVITSCSSNQLSYIKPGDKLSLFTRHLIESLRQPFSGTTHLAELSILKLASQITEAVSFSAQNELKPRCLQVPWCVIDGQDIVLTRYNA